MNEFEEGPEYKPSLGQVFEVLLRRFLGDTVRSKAGLRTPPHRVIPSVPAAQSPFQAGTII